MKNRNFFLMFSSLSCDAITDLESIQKNDQFVIIKSHNVVPIFFSSCFILIPFPVNIMLFVTVLALPGLAKKIILSARKSLGHNYE